jgi:ribosomal protein S18 acetylase RimI-like enzyme
MEYQVRRLTVEDVDSVVALTKRFTEDQFPFSYWELNEDDVRWLCGTPERDVLVVEIGGEIVGIGSVSYGGSAGHLSAGIDRDHRRRGLATLLITELIQIAASKPCSTVTAQVWEKNVPSQELFLSLGFTNPDHETVVHQNPAFGQMVSLVFRKEIGA